MARLARVEMFAPDEIAIVHVMNRVVRRCFLFGDDPVSGKNFDHRKVWIEDQLRVQAACFGIDRLGFALMPISLNRCTEIAKILRHQLLLPPATGSPQREAPRQLRRAERYHPQEL